MTLVPSVSGTHSSRATSSQNPDLSSEMVGGRYETLVPYLAAARPFLHRLPTGRGSAYTGQAVVKPAARDVGGRT